MNAQSIAAKEKIQSKIRNMRDKRTGRTERNIRTISSKLASQDTSKKDIIDQLRTLSTSYPESNEAVDVSMTFHTPANISEKHTPDIHKEDGTEEVQITEIDHDNAPETKFVCVTMGRPAFRIP